ncbi:MAG: hypothetical protein HQK55_00460 [Deltaproteobacteria bacterium]|nr:hypothetical protein [Deltaproteobacteria bacterium]
MNAPNSDHHNQQPPTVMGPTAKKLRTAMLVCLGVLVGLNLIVHPHHPHFELEKLPGFWAVFGLVGAILLTKIAKGAAHTFLGKPENFYEKNK